MFVLPASARVAAPTELYPNVTVLGMSVSPFCVLRILSCSVLFYSVLFYSVLFCFILFCFILFCFILFCSILFCSVLFCSILSCPVLSCPETLEKSWRGSVRVDITQAELRQDSKHDVATNLPQYKF